jgi:hypothetical protein
MGRPSIHADSDYSGKLSLQRIRLNGDYEVIENKVAEFERRNRRYAA